MRQASTPRPSGAVSQSRDPPVEEPGAPIEDSGQEEVALRRSRQSAGVLPAPDAVSHRSDPAIGPVTEWPGDEEDEGAAYLPYPSETLENAADRGRAHERPIARDEDDCRQPRLFGELGYDSVSRLALE